MKTKTTHEQITRTILIALITLGFAGVVCWSLLSPDKRPMAPPVAPPLAAPSGGPSFVYLVGRRGLPSGPVAGAVDATTRAVAAANEAALRDYQVEPFSDAKPSAKFDGRRWSWRKRIGCGPGDFEAEVTIAPSGIVESVTVRYTTQQLAQM
jgi:hypothetical protein